MCQFYVRFTVISGLIFMPPSTQNIQRSCRGTNASTGGGAERKLTRQDDDAPRSGEQDTGRPGSRVPQGDLGDLTPEERAASLAMDVRIAEVQENWARDMELAAAYERQREFREANYHAYLLDRGNGVYTPMIPADLLPPLVGIPATLSNPWGYWVLQHPPMRGFDGLWHYDKPVQLLVSGNKKKRILPSSRSDSFCWLLLLLLW